MFVYYIHFLYLTGHTGGCGVNDETVQWMERIQHSATEDMPNIKPSLSAKNKKRTKKQKLMEKNIGFEDDLKYPHIKYTKEANWNDLPVESNDGDDWHQKSHERAKRAARSKEENRNTCSLYIQTDPLIWRHIREGIADVNLFPLF